MKIRTTMQQVADLANVSTATVSRVFNTPDKVSVKTRYDVEKAIEILDYHYHKIKYCVKPLSKPIKILVLYSRESYNQEIFFGIENISQQLNYQILFIRISTLSPQHLDRLLSRVILEKTDGILVIGATPLLTQLESEFKKLPPIVVVNHYTQHYSCLYIDHLTLAYNACNYFKSKGHQYIACVLEKNMAENSYIQQGYHQSLKRNDITFYQDYMLYTQDDIHAGTTALSKLMSLPIPPTAIFCHNENIAHGVLYQAKKKQITIPDQLALICFNHSQYSQYIEPSLTVINKPLREMGEKSVSLLIQQITYPINGIKSILLESEFIIRQSTA